MASISLSIRLPCLCQVLLLPSTISHKLDLDLREIYYDGILQEGNSCGFGMAMSYLQIDLVAKKSDNCHNLKKSVVNLESQTCIHSVIIVLVHVEMILKAYSVHVLLYLEIG